ncbi:MAG: NADPH:quinone reductase [Actinomycetota bacterium]|nr:NADPH:quinone reductase [Actinomycetota bacterium]
MKAAAYHHTGPPSVLEYLDVPDPVVRPRDVLIQVEAISIEGGDTLNRLGGAMSSDPHIVGYQCAGTIVEVGSDAGDRAPAVGTKVVATMASGSHAELVAVPAAGVWPIPDGADVVAAACVPVAFGTAHDCLFEFGRLQAGETVLVQAAAGGVGVAAVQLASRAGARVLATASSPERLARLSPLGLAEGDGIDYSVEDAAVGARRLTDGRGVDLVVDPVGGSTLASSFRALAYRGRCITVGNAGREFTPVDVSSLMHGNQSLTGVFLGAEIATPRARQMIADLIADVASGALTVLVDRTYPLSEAAAAHGFIESRAAVGRVVLVP